MYKRGHCLKKVWKNGFWHFVGFITVVKGKSVQNKSKKGMGRVPICRSDLDITLVSLICVRGTSVERCLFLEDVSLLGGGVHAPHNNY